MSFEKVPIFFPNRFEVGVSENENKSYRFRSFVLNVSERQLFDGTNVKPLTPKAFDVLVHLVENAGHLVRKDELIKAVWPDTFVEEANVPRSVHHLRKALGEDRNGNKFIETVTKCGYRFVAPVGQLVEDAGDRQFTPEEDLCDLDMVRKHRREGLLEVADSLATKCAAAYQTSGDRLGIAMAYREISLCQRLLGNYLRSIEFSEFALEGLSKNHEPILVAKIFTDIAGANWALRRHEKAVRLLSEGISLLRKSQDNAGLVTAYNNLGYLLIQIGKWIRAERVLAEGIRIARDSNDKNLPGILDTWAELYLRKGRIDAAIVTLNEAISVAKESGSEFDARVPMRNLARCQLANGLMKDAYATAKAAKHLCEAMNDKRYLVWSNLVLAEACLLLGSIGESSRLLEEVQKEGVAVDFFALGEVQRLKGLIDLELGSNATAMTFFNRSRAIFEKDSDIYNVAVMDLLLGHNLSSILSAEATPYLKQAAKVFRKLSNDRLLNMANSTLSKLPKDDSRK